MKKTLAIVALCLAAAGCANREKQAQACAQEFLGSFLSNDYNAAAECCTGSFREEFVSSTASFRDLDSNVRALLVNECGKFRAEVLSAQRKEDTDTVIVDYRIVRKADSLAFERGAISGTLVVVDGKIASQGK